MKTLSKSIFALILSFGLASAAFGQGGVTLKPNLVVGKAYTIVQKMNMTMPNPAGAGEVGTDMEYATSVKVAAAEKEGHKNVSVAFEAAKMKMSMGGQVLEFDSTDENNQNPMLKMSMGPMMDMKFTALYDQNDEFVEVVDAPKGGGGPMGPAMGEAEFRQMVDSLVNHGFPDKPLKPGDTWEHTIDMPMGQLGKMETKMNYTFAGMDERNGKKYPKLTFTGEVSGEANVAGNAMIQFKDSDINGWLLWDEESGLATYSETDMDMTMAIGGAQGAEMKTKTKATTELVKIEDVE
ncbi:MAG: hypothetical protein AAGA58_04270 [Verrucomicrobiota bacterium]